ncbi:unnamed protein product [Sphagnum troendelagicum]|uniref:Uncharacterized protein n=1 Tax=Sphagnum troendelagicum TaxID=128251 RepID=A0ABP0U7C2_9BRYO
MRRFVCCFAEESRSEGDGHPTSIKEECKVPLCWLSCFAYFLNASPAIRLVEQAKYKAYDSALQSALAQGMARKEAERHSQKLAQAAGKEKSCQARRISGPLFAAVWDTFEVLYYGGSFLEASMQASGTLCGTWLGALEGEKRMGRVGYLVGGQIGSWVGSRLALMVYDIGKAGQLLVSEMSGPLFGIDNNGGDEL